MKHSKTIRCVSALMVALCLLLCSMMTAFAGDGSGGGNGDGTGGGKDQPLVLASSSIANGAENVSQTPQIVLTFSKNVVHFTVRDNNKKCFSMTDEDGKSVPINVLMGDDQVDPSIKRIVTITPQSALTPGTTYLLKIGGGITSKSGVSIGRDSYIAFTVAGEKPTTAPPTTTATPTTTTKPTTTKPTTTKPATTKPATTKPATTKPTTTKPTTTKPTTTKATTTTKAAVAVTTTVTTTKPTTTTPVTTEATTTTAVTTTQTTTETTTEVTTTETTTETTSRTTTAVTSSESETASEPVPETVSASGKTNVVAQKTGVRFSPLFWILISAIAIIALFAVILIIKKKTK